MTAPRSFREAFTEDPADVKDRARLVAERDSARDWAVALEGQNARLEAKIAAVAASAERIGAWVEFHTANHGGKPRELTDVSYWTKPLYLSDLAAVAALTGGEDA